MTLNSVQYLHTASLGKTTIQTANPNLDGAGSINTIITGATNGTFVKTIIIKAQTDTSQGMVRLFVKKSGGSNVLLTEFYISPIIKSSRDLSYYNTISVNYTLETNEELRVSTENSDTINVIAEAFDISYSTNASYLGSSLEYIANVGVGVVNTANPNLDGTGTMSRILLAGSVTSGFNGCAINSMIVKAMATTTPGIIRLFLQDAEETTPILFCEIIIPSVVQSATIQAFTYQIIGQGALCIPAGFSLWASTELSEPFNIIAEGVDWKYV